MRGFSESVIAWAMATAILFVIGWAAVAFIWIDEAAIPLTTHGSRAWLVFCGLLIAGLMVSEDSK